MNKTLLALLLIIGGGVTIYLGTQRKNSVAGAAQSVGHDVASVFDGKTRLNDHTLYFIGGGGLILAGIAIGMRRG